MKKIYIFIAIFLLSSPAFAATNVPFTIAMSEAVNVTGSPRIAVDVGGVTRYATYASGTGTSSLTFTYAAQAGDVDLDGVTISSPIDLNGGTITDLNGNPETDLTFTVPDTSGIKIDYPSLSMDFIADADGRYTLNGTAYNDLPAFLSATGGTFARNSVGTYFDSSGVLQTASADQPRFDHDPITHAPKGILIEESRTNLFAYSDQFENAYWLTSGAFITANATTAPDGTVAADKIIGNNGQSARKSLYKAISTTAGNKYTFSVYLKQAERSTATIWFDETYITEGAYYGSGTTINLATGTSTNPAIIQVTPVGNGWYRCAITATPSSTATVRFSIAVGLPNGGDFTGNAVDGIYAWGAQIEQGAFPTSYIPTTSAAVTRNIDLLTIPTMAWFNAPAGSFMFQGDVSAPIFLGTLVALSAGAAYNTGNGFLVRYGTGNPQAGGNCCSVNLAAGFSVNSPFKVSASYNGVTQRIATSTLINSNTNNDFTGVGTTTLLLGSIRTDGLQSIGSGHAAVVKYYPVAPSNTQLQLLTTP